MPYYKCTNCHHEFELSDENEVVLCNLCGSPSIILEEKTPLEEMLDDILEKEEKIWKGFIRKRKKKGKKKNV